MGMLSAIVVITELLVRKTALKHLGTAILVIIITAVFANVGLLPTGSSDSGSIEAYDFVFSTIAPLAIFWLLLPVNLKDVMKAGKAMVFLFLFGSLATAIGVFAGMWVVNGSESIGPLYNALGGIFVGTYTGGSVNFNSLGLHYDVMKDGVLYGGAIEVIGYALSSERNPKELAEKRASEVFQYYRNLGIASGRIHNGPAVVIPEAELVGLPWSARTVSSRLAIVKN